MAKRKHPVVPTDVDDQASLFFEALKNESDRGCVIVAAAFIEDALEVLLRASMSRQRSVVKETIDPLFKGIGPLSSSWAKAELCRANKLIPEWLYKDLAKIRDLRNQFAHTYRPASFGDVAVLDTVSKLHAFGWSPATPGPRVKATANSTMVRKSFMCAAGLIGGTLVSSAKKLHAI